MKEIAHEIFSGFVSSGGEEIATILPHAQIVEIPGTGHSPYFEDAAVWNGIVFDFLARQRSW